MSCKKMIKALVQRLISPSRLDAIKVLVSRVNGGNKYRMASGSELIKGKSVIRHCVFDVRGRNCRIEIADNNYLIGCKILIFADNCIVTIGRDNSINKATFWLEDNGSSINIGNSNNLTGTIQLDAIEGCSINIGNDNLFSSEIQISTGDSHSVVDNATGMRTNPSKNVNIGNHIWVGARTKISKGVNIADDIIIGGYSVVTKSFEKSHCAVAGVPAKIIKGNVSWLYDRI